MTIAKRAVWLAVLALTGCQAPFALHQWRQPLFALGPDAPSVAVPNQTAARPTMSGDLTVNFASELAKLRKRSVLATVADVDRVVVTVKPNGAAEVSQTVQKAAIANGQATVTFSGLPVGDAVVTITAYDAGGASVGTSTKTAVVTAGQVATVDVSLHLAPTYISPGGGSAPTTGGLTAQVTLKDGVVVPGPAKATGQIIGTYALDFYPVALKAAPDGDVWVGGGGKVVKIAPDGTVRFSLQVAGVVDAIAVDAAGSLWVIESYSQTSAFTTLSKFNRLGQKLGEWESVVGGNFQLTVAGDGSLFIANVFSGEFSRWDPGTQTATKLTIGPNLGSMAVNVATDPHGDVLLLVYDFVSNKLLRFAPDGTKRSEVTLTVAGNNLAIDGLGHPWVSRDTLHKLRPDGSLVGTFSGFTMTDLAYQFDQHMGFDSQNHGWVLSDAGLKQVAPDGTVLGTYAVPAKTQRVSVGPAGVWSNTRHQTGTNYVTLTAI